ncbi:MULTISPECIES: citrate synthase [Rhizobium]|uniref:citrate synthase (unknown stereospecificity) n=1 Tax=Rhizobium paranaense TaxID=1650438 RepID=A0A7W9D018_9HYPH|nr:MULTISPECIES: citrate synthase [Rhizobium]MBB5572585.1 citrate synthase [Rhizobium paranaense]PST63614.1 citrate synthase [Rhizobium sp. SEMIA4064]
MSWLTTEQALTLLGTKSQTLYANVSRGRIRAKPDPADTRRSLYFADDVKRLAARHAGRRKTELVAADAIQWGDPVLPSALSTISHGRLFYRGQDAAKLAEHATLEEVALLLWDMKRPLRLGGKGAHNRLPTLTTAFAALAERAPTDLPSLGRSLPALQTEAESVFGTVADALAPGPSHLPLHQRLAEVWNRSDAGELIRCSLVLLADHELNASTFTARITASAGATLSAAVLSGLATLTGPLHGGAWQSVRSLMDRAAAIGAEEAVRSYLAEGRPLTAIGHRLYPDGDARAQALLACFTLPPLFAEVRNVAEELVGERVNVDFALTAMASAYHLPQDAPLIIFALSRTVGWLAHAMEQSVSGHLIRPRARYVGPPVE